MFRVSVRGKFRDLTDDQRTALRSGLEAARTAFTPEGSFSSDAGLAVFTFRIQLTPESDDEDEDDAGLRALAALDATGYPYEVIKIAATDMRTIKIPSKRRRA
ncbi:hypothetical protein SRB5_21550 [Streptomyces sp. RB5]|uniref:Uncharacterized protein n=1 Tax=Streptomyces smaragdinus TaxID=2585196 RepID=A0A7K0CF59_9ACTN|nr:DUF6204 family protein [Streptomyces smaragdinus]MQY12026.1 hypothetical protein [Streptomyces smaragdinus]